MALLQFIWSQTEEMLQSELPNRVQNKAQLKPNGFCYLFVTSRLDKGHFTKLWTSNPRDCSAEIVQSKHQNKFNVTVK